MASDIHAQEVAQGERFEFGKNWSLYLKGMTEEKILAAEESLKNMLRVETLEGMSFLDAGSGSGLFSLAAKRLGADVTSFDFDPDSVNCTKSLKSIHFPYDDTWRVFEGSVLDRNFMGSLDKFDFVYSWGVLHHTGNMVKAFENVANSVSENGMIFIAIYNDQGLISDYWTYIKRLYNSGRIGRCLATAIPLPYFLAHRLFRIVVPKKRQRGMDWWRDVLDWVGGYPFEVGTPEKILDFFYDLGFVMVKQKTVNNKHGCNEFVFRKKSDL